MTNPLLLLAADQRPWLTKELYGHTGSASADERAFITEAKHMIFEALRQATADGGVDGAGMLVDPILGPGVPERVKQQGLRLAMPLERAGLALYETEPEDLAGYLAHYEPDYAKVLVRYRCDDPSDDRLVQRQRLAEASQACADAGVPFIFELLVGAKGEDPDRFENEIRPGLTVSAMAEIGADVPVDIWKLEPQGPAEGYRDVVALAESMGSTCVLLGAGAPLPTVHEWIATAAREGFVGFAVGRTLWADAVNALRADASTRDHGVTEIGERYLGCAQQFLSNWSAGSAE